MFSSRSQKNLRFVLKERWDSLGKIIFTKRKIVVCSVEPSRSAPCAPEEQAASVQSTEALPCTSRSSAPPLRSQELQAPGTPHVGRGTPCVPLGSESADQPFDLGERYTVLSKLGQGGSASVYKIRDNQLGKIFAAKVMRQELLPDNHAQLRFKQEAEAASYLTHPNLIAVYGSGITSDKAPYLVMDCLSGKTLAETLKEEGALDSARAVGILEQCCEALGHMHMKGIVHRDIKPSNIFLTKAENGTDMVKIVDFGIAKIQAYQDSTHLTQTGAVFGSPLYMSPEQCRGEQLDFRSDIYSLGCVAYEMLTGVSPFADSNPIKTIVKHISGSVTPPGEAAPQYHITEAFQSVIMRCLETDPKKRYQTVDELRNQLGIIRTAGSLKTVRHELFPSLYRRLAASLIDGTILSALVLGCTSLVAMSLHMPFHLLSQFGVLFPLTPGACTFIFLFWSFTIAFFGPTLATMIWLLSFIRADNDSLLFWLELSLGLLISWLYFATFESSKYSGTPGKKILGLTVVNSQGKKLSFLHATGRYVSKIFLLPLLNLENSIRVVRRMAEPLRMRFLRYGKELLTMVPNPPKPPTDDWTRSYVINTTAHNNPYLPNVQEYLHDETKGLRDLNEINEKLKIVRGALYWSIGFSLLVILILVTNTVAAKKLPDPITWSFWLAYISIWATPAVIYYRRFKRRKHQLLTDRNKKLAMAIQKD